MEQAKVLIHIGYHKTATSALQKQLFSASDGPFASPHGEQKYVLSNRFVLPQPLTFDSSAIREQYADFLETSRNSGKVAVFSHERFSGYPASGGFDSPMIAQRLKQTFPEAHVLIVFREQLSSILSMYSQYITDGGHKSLKGYLAQIEPMMRRVPMFSPDFYRYDRLFKYYQTLFGPERVHGLTYEQFVQDSDAFVSRLCKSLDISSPQCAFVKTNTKRSQSFQVLQRGVNRIFSNNQLSTGALIPFPYATRRFGKLSGPISRIFPKGLDQMLEQRMAKLVAAQFEGTFAESNANLQELTGLQLDNYGYQLPPDAH
ncbi:sulfotransferase [Rhodobacteraceae bacterium B1Z28]|uniref:Sulfotransferase n=1 Tax=Ruegeria haliotis TaxID=2747601 RepID=A0ABX2PTL4_9RHOB|nr:sulfotransferase [Ruegeria haliotis]NVO56389.1 sulfotransferase [Ruegeria haliotis]